MRRLLLFPTIAAVALRCSPFESDDAARPPPTTNAEAGGPAVVTPPREAGPPFCEGDASFFCWSFEGDPLPYGPRLRPYSTGYGDGGVLTEGRSTPNALLLAVDRQIAILAPSAASAELAIPSTYATLECTVAMYVEESPRGGLAHVLSVLNQGAALEMAITFDPASETTVPVRLYYGRPGLYEFIGNIGMRTWTEITLRSVVSTFADGGSERSATGVVPGATPLTMVTYHQGLTPTSTVRFGVEAYNDEPAWRVRYDDLRCNMQ